jgi:hypothetical protein
LPSLRPNAAWHRRRKGRSTAAPARTPVRREAQAAVHAAVAAFQPPSAWPIYLVAFVVAVLWALAPIAFA